MRFIDSKIEHFLKENGFCKFDLRAKDILPQLENIYNEYFLNLSEKDFYVTHNNGNVSKISHVHNELVNLCEPIIAKYWTDFEIFAAHFVIKKANNNSSFQLHQDWCNIEESIDNSVQIWIPLSLSYPENGGMGFVPKSHLFFNNYRSGSFGIPHVKVEPKLYPYLSYLRLFPGEAAFFYNSTFHCSFINSTDVDRVAVLLNIAPKSQKKIYFHKNENRVEKYELSTIQLYERLHLFEKGELPQGLKLIERSIYQQEDNTTIDADLLIAKLMELNEKQTLPADYEVKLFNLIKDEGIEKEINLKGFKVIDFLSSKEREEILDLLDQYPPNKSKDINTLLPKVVLNSDNKYEINQGIQKIIEAKLIQYFNDAYIPACNFHSKKLDESIDFDWQRNPSFILNEQLEPQYGLWFNLQEIEDNDTLSVVPGSHRLIKRLDTPTERWESILSTYLRNFDVYGSQITLQPGQALLYDSRILKSLKSNISKIEKHYLAVSVIHKKSLDFFSFQEDNAGQNKSQVFRVPQDILSSSNSKKHQENQNTSEGVICHFEYPMSKSNIQDYFEKLFKNI